LSKLIKGEEIVSPAYNFFTGKKEYDPKDKLKLENNGIIIIEGLHCINEKLTESIEKKNKYKIYISPFNSLTIDRHNHISTVDMRFLRRMVRDNLFRGYSPEHTLESWKNVRAGEKKYLFSHLQEAEVVLNTAMIYEIGVLKVYASPLLYSIKPESPHYEESRRILNFLNSFFSIPSEFIPDDSIVREFIGGSYFNK
jgi:uridine kinase